MDPHSDDSASVGSPPPASPVDHHLPQIAPQRSTRPEAAPAPAPAAPEGRAEAEADSDAKAEAEAEAEAEAGAKAEAEAEARAEAEADSDVEMVDAEAADADADADDGPPDANAEGPPDADGRPDAGADAEGPPDADGGGGSAVQDLTAAPPEPPSPVRSIPTEIATLRSRLRRAAEREDSWRLKAEEWEVRFNEERERTEGLERRLAEEAAESARRVPASDRAEAGSRYDAERGEADAESDAGGGESRPSPRTPREGAARGRGRPPGRRRRGGASSGEKTSSSRPADKRRRLLSPSRHDEYWLKRFDMLRKWVEKHGNTRVPDRIRPLGVWVRSHREQFGKLRRGKRSTLTEERIRKLNGLGFEWQLGDASWMERLGELRSFKEKHGHCRLPRDHPLWVWAGSQRGQRELMEKGEPSGTTKERVDLLEKLGFDWEGDGDGDGDGGGSDDEEEAEDSVSEAEEPSSEDGDYAPKAGGGGRKRLRGASRGHVERWNAHLGELKKFRAERGHFNVRRGDDGSLFRWLRRQRSMAAAGTLPRDRRRALDALGLSWLGGKPAAAKASSPAPASASGGRGESNEDRWDERLADLRRFHAKHGHFEVPRGEGPLFHWARNQRANFSAGTLSGRRRQALEAIGFTWSKRSATELNWDDQLEALKDFKAEHGHFDVLPADRPLFNWVKKLRAKAAAGTLPEERRRALDGIGFVWDKRSSGLDRRWDRHFRELRAFQRDRGHLDVRRGYDRGLWNWIRNQRTFYERGTLSEERRDALDSIGFIWKRRSSDFWSERFDELEEFWMEKGHCDVTRDKGALYKWCQTQRCNKDSLSKERRELLDSLGFVWNKGSLLREQREQKWNEMLEKFKKFKEEHGHLDVPSDAGELGAWVRKQHLYYRQFQMGRQSSITPERKKALDDLGFVCKSTRRSRGTGEVRRSSRSPRKTGSGRDDGAAEAGEGGNKGASAKKSKMEEVVGPSENKKEVVEGSKDKGSDDNIEGHDEGASAEKGEMEEVAGLSENKGGEADGSKDKGSDDEKDAEQQEDGINKGASAMDVDKKEGDIESQDKEEGAEEPEDKESTDRKDAEQQEDGKAEGQGTKEVRMEVEGEDHEPEEKGEEAGPEGSDSKDKKDAERQEDGKAEGQGTEEVRMETEGEEPEPEEKKGGEVGPEGSDSKDEKDAEQQEDGKAEGQGTKEVRMEVEGEEPEEKKGGEARPESGDSEKDRKDAEGQKVGKDSVVSTTEVDSEGKGRESEENKGGAEGSKDGGSNDTKDSEQQPPPVEELERGEI